MTPLISSRSDSLFFSSGSSGFMPLLFAFVVADLQTRSFLFAFVVQPLLAVRGVFPTSIYPSTQNFRHAAKP